MVGINSSPRDPHDRGDGPDGESCGQADDGLDLSGKAEAVGGPAEVGPNERGGHQQEQAGEDLVQRCAGHPGCPGGAGPGAREATGKKIDRDQPGRRQLAVGHRNQPRRQRGQHHRQAHRLVQDHRLQGDKAEQADQQRQPKLRTAETDHAAQQPDRSGAAERRHR
jgi:hypothetical protein